MIQDLFIKNNSQRISQKELDYFTVSALFVAVKLKSVILFSLRDFVKLCFSCDKRENVEECLKAELALLGGIFFKINCNSYFDIICYHLSRIFNSDVSQLYFKLENMVQCLYIILILDHRIYEFDQEELVAVVLLIGMEKVGLMQDKREAYSD